MYSHFFSRYFNLTWSQTFVLSLYNTVYASKKKIILPSSISRHSHGNERLRVRPDSSSTNDNSSKMKFIQCITISRDFMPRSCDTFEYIVVLHVFFQCNSFRVTNAGLLLPPSPMNETSAGEIESASDSFGSK